MSKGYACGSVDLDGRYCDYRYLCVVTGGNTNSYQSLKGAYNRPLRSGLLVQAYQLLPWTERYDIYSLLATIDHGRKSLP